ncbi:CBU_0592 family membrane protein [Roseobacteraceae bacterium S113]
MLAYDVSALDAQTFFRAIGLLGFCIYVAAFFGLSMGRLDSTRPLYFAMVLVASSCVLASLWVDFNLSAALIQTFYIAMSLGAIVLRLRKWRAVQPPQPRST